MSLEVVHLSKKYGDKTAVEDLSFSLNNPGVYALLGTNGAGKSTSIRMILGILEKDSGSVLWNGRELDPHKINVGYLAEERGLYPKYSLMDQLMYFAALKGMTPQEAKERIELLADKLEVREYLFPEKKVGKRVKDMTADQLSKGNQQKIQLMAALLSDPELLILDEPLSGLDPVNTDLFRSIIHKEIDKGKYIILSSHQMAVIEEFCEDITILNKGKVAAGGNLNEIKKSYGRINLIVKCDEGLSDVEADPGMTVISDTPDGVHFRVQTEAVAQNYLGKLASLGKTVVRFELREPSLHEIFVEKVGGHEIEE
ncbi:ABC transporter ATP-binding protein [Butyrivibrio sp. MC2013]|uniref:ABC transporter ATP-binding protein n=1 Tax=Butyrivibrio sp. MC2013 TaxID=1280686 RepID=UPI000421B014|nr:ATP-binding cassette domain-containing protein [Butyrivibrio sp. MC2013]